MQKAAVLVLNLMQLEHSSLSVLFGQPLTGGICQPSIPPSTPPTPPAWKCHLHLQGIEEARWGEEPSSLCPLAREGGQVQPEGKYSFAEASQERGTTLCPWGWREPVTGPAAAALLSAHVFEKGGFLYGPIINTYLLRVSPRGNHISLGRGRMISGRECSG